MNKTSASNECDICHSWYFLNKGFNLQSNICKRCHDLLMMPMKLSDIVIKGFDYRCIISGIRKK